MANQYKPQTLLVHAGHAPECDFGIAPIYQSSAYNLGSAQRAQDLFSLGQKGNIYTRIMNPTTDIFEERMAALEGGVAALAFASGHAAIVGALTNIAQAGDEIASSPTLYGGTYNLFAYTLPRLGIKVNFADSAKPADLARAITPRTKAVFAETIGNPKLDVLDTEAAADVAHTAGVPLIVDATFSPYINRALDHGADIVVHSATKYIDGHGTSMGGVVVDAGRFAYDSGKFPLMSEADPSYHGLRFCDLGPAGYITRLRTQILRDMGACIAPFNSFLLAKGLQTLHLRMERHCSNALTCATFLQAHPKVSWINYPGLDSHPDRALAQKYLPNGAGGLMTFGIKGGKAAAQAFIDALQLVSHVANLGDVRTLVIHPASTTHSQLDGPQKAASGTTDDMIRLSVGIEDVGDIIGDLTMALDGV